MHLRPTLLERPTPPPPPRRPTGDVWELLTWAAYAIVAACIIIGAAA
jgi:hypothetical protein